MDSTLLQSVLIPHNNDALTLLNFRTALHHDCTFIPTYPLWGIFKDAQALVHRIEKNESVQCTLNAVCIENAQLLLPGTLHLHGKEFPFTFTLGTHILNGTCTHTHAPLATLRVFRIAHVHYADSCWSIVRQQWIKTK